MQKILDGSRLFVKPFGSGVFVLQLEGSKRWLIQPPAPSHRLPLAYQPRQKVSPITRQEGSVDLSS